MNIDDAVATRAPFIDAVRRIKRAQGIRLSQTLTPQARSAFLTAVLRDQDALAHLCRPATQVAFSAGIPQLTLPAADTPQKKAARTASDYHESKVHALLEQVHRTPFRGVLPTAFTTQGANPTEFELIFEAFAAEVLPMHQVVTRPMDFSDLRPLLWALAYAGLPGEHQPHFALTPLWNPEHALAVVTIYDPQLRVPLVSIFLNSFMDPGRFEQVANIFNPPENPETPVPIVDASHALQTSMTDFCCTIYSYNILRAASQLLQSETTADVVQELAMDLKAGNTMAVNGLRRVFTEEIKAFLPQYYDTQGKVRSREELDTYNASARWDLGAQGIALLAKTLQGQGEG